MTPVIVPFYAAVLALAFVALSRRVIRARRAEKVAIGDGGNPRLQRAISVHNNFAQYVPLALLLLAFIEMRAAPALLVHGLCLLLLTGRALHAFGVSQTEENYGYRIRGMKLTFATLWLSALYLLADSGLRLMI